MFKKKVILFLITLIILTGCTVIKDDGFSGLIDTVLYKESKVTNKNFEGYSFYLPIGTSIIDKSEYNIKLKDKDCIYYLYVDTVAYHYQTNNEYVLNGNVYSEKIKNGFIDVRSIDDKYFIVLMYNYAKIEAFVSKEDYIDVFARMCNILSSVKYNDTIISTYVDSNNKVSQEEKFDIFSSNQENDNFIKYEQEFDNYKEREKDNDIIDIESID